MARRAGAAASGLSTPRRKAMEAEIKALYDAMMQAEEDLYIYLHRAQLAGFTTREMADVLPVTQNTTQRWARQGAEAREKRQKGATAPVEALSSDT